MNTETIFREAIVKARENLKAEMVRAHQGWLSPTEAAALRDRAEKAEAEARNWKAVERQWDVQRIGEKLGLPFGASIRQAIEPAIDELLRLRDLNAAVRATEVNLDEEITGTIRQTATDQLVEQFTELAARVKAMRAEQMRTGGLVSTLREQIRMLKEAAQ